MLANLQNVTSLLVPFQFLSNTTTNMSPRGALIALAHGGGPLPLLGDPGSAAITKSLRTRVPQLLRLNHPDPALRPRAIVVVTAHWVTSKPSISSGASHSLLYDYYGFPPETYEYKYPAPGAPELAKRLAGLIKEEGLGEAVLDAKRGWDHGVFVPLLLARPEADLPVLQVSVLEDESPEKHFALGRALRRLREEENVAVMGSGFASFHNLRLMRSWERDLPNLKVGNKEWSKAVTAAAEERDEKKREGMFKGWRNWPDAYVSHPKGGAEHFMPLVVSAGAVVDGEEPKHYIDETFGLDIYSYYWE